MSDQETHFFLDLVVFLSCLDNVRFSLLFTNLFGLLGQLSDESIERFLLKHLNYISSWDNEQYPRQSIH